MYHSLKLHASLSWPLPANSARFGYATKRGTTQSSVHLSTETASSVLLGILDDQSFSSAGVRMSSV